MLAIARQRAADLGRDVDFRQGDAEHLPFDDASFDTVVCAPSLCTIPNPAMAIGEMKRPGPGRPIAAARPHRQHLAADLCRPMAPGTDHHPCGR